jgi:hypothetical protein
MPITVVFLAAGRSTRYRRPKQLEPVGPSGQSLLDYGIFDALRGGAGRLIIVTRRHMRAALEDHLETVFGPLPVSFALQDAGEGRLAGTGHAVLAAAGLVREPFAVANADDFYGRAAWATLLRYLDGVPPEGSYAVVGYPLAATLSPAGGVSRAMCQVDDGDVVEAISEWRDIRRVGDGVEGTDLSGLRAILDPDAWVSMNLWGFTPALFDELRLQSQHFGQREADGAGVEFLLSEAVNAQMMAGNATVRLLPAHEAWFGLTHPADRSTVQARLEALTSEGTYPARFDLHPPG